VDNKDLTDKLKELFSEFSSNPGPEAPEDQPSLEYEVFAGLLGEDGALDPSITAQLTPVDAQLPGEAARVICPYLGLRADPSLRYAYPQAAHRCYVPLDGEVPTVAHPIDLEYQEAYCLVADYSACQRYAAASDGDQTSPDAPRAAPSATVVRQVNSGRRVSPWRTLLWALAGLVFLAGLVYFALSTWSAPDDGQPRPEGEGAIPAATATLTATPQALDTPALPLAAGASIHTITLWPAADQVGWVASDETGGIHLGDSFLNAGVYADQVYYSLIQIDLSEIPRGAQVRSVRLRLVGLRSAQLGGSGTWKVRWLAPQAAEGWAQHSYPSIAQAPYLETLAPALRPDDLGDGRENYFVFSPAQLQALTDAVARQHPFVLRLDGPLSGADSLFAWDSGHGPASRGALPSLVLDIALDGTPASSQTYTVVTSTPTPENVLTAAAMSLRLTAQATRQGTATPLPWYWVTATPIPEGLISTAAPTPENRATADYLNQVATAQALTTGTPTPAPPDMMTATPTATPTPTLTPVIITSTPTPLNALTAQAVSLETTAQAQAHGRATPLPANWVTPIVVTPTPTPGNTATLAHWRALATAQALTTGTPTPLPGNLVTATPTPVLVLITSTPTPLSELTAQAMSLGATAQAQVHGTATPLPSNWVTPIVVTSTPTPENAATLTHWRTLATARALTTGTPTPVPANMVTATPTPAFALLDGALPTRVPTSTPTPTPAPIPAQLVGKIAFLSDRATLANDPDAMPLSDPLVYVINPDGTGLAILPDRWPYDQAIQRDAFAADQRFRGFVKDVLRWEPGEVARELWTRGFVEERPASGLEVVPVLVPAIFYYDAYYAAEGQVTTFGGHIAAYDPVWSPTSEQIAFVANDGGNDEIWVIHRDGEDARQLTRDNFDWWDKHPSWSPDGQQIVFWSNRTGIRQIWIIDVDGGNLRSLSQTGFNDWDPVWLKYTDPPRDDLGQ
jgi:hypothetical protein